MSFLLTYHHHSDDDNVWKRRSGIYHIIKWTFTIVYWWSNIDIASATRGIFWFTIFNISRWGFVQSHIGSCVCVIVVIMLWSLLKIYLFIFCWFGLYKKKIVISGVWFSLMFYLWLKRKTEPHTPETHRKKSS